MPLIPAEQARKQTSSFEMSQEQVLENMSFAIDANSKQGQKSVIAYYLRSAVSQQELDGAMAIVRSNGYAADMVDLGGDSVNFAVKISW